MSTRERIDRQFEEFEDDSPDPRFTPQVQKLAAEFCLELRRTLGDDGVARAVAANRLETHPGVCHSHDECDANMAMDAAMTTLGIEHENLAQDEELCVLWNAAWNLAKKIHFDV
jgi:hypothetical protein